MAWERHFVECDTNCDESEKLIPNEKQLIRPKKKSENSLSLKGATCGAKAEIKEVVLEEKCFLGGN